MDRRLGPQVTADMLDGERAYLLGWERLPAGGGGGWGRAYLLGGSHRGGRLGRSGGVVSANSVHQVGGQDYTQVPRDPTPTDPSDPRDPKSRKYARDEAYLEALQRRNPPSAEELQRRRRMDGPF